MTTKVINGVTCRVLKRGEVVIQGDRYDNGAHTIAMIGFPETGDYPRIWRPIKTKPAKSEGRRKTLEEIYNDAAATMHNEQAWRAVERAVIKRERRRIYREVMERVRYVSERDASWMERVMKEVAP